MVAVGTSVIPAAGLGTRMAPLSMAVPKELLPLGDRPLLQWAIEEAVAAGAKHIHLVVSPEKQYDNFCQPPKAYREALQKGGASARRWLALLEEITITSSLQKKPLGLGHAVLQAAEFVKDDHFFVQLPDEWYPQQGCLSDLKKTLGDHPGGCLSVMEVPRAMTNRYGIVDVTNDDPGHLRIRNMVEKPDPETAPSCLAITGRYLLPASIFDLLAVQPPGKGGEIQLTDALQQLLSSQDVYAVPLAEPRYDTGNLDDYQNAWKKWFSGED